MNNELQLCTIVTRAHTKSLQLITTRKKSIGKTISEVPQISIISSEMVSAIAERKALIGRLIYSYEEGRIDIVTTSQLLNTMEIGHLKPNDSKVLFLESPATNILAVEIAGRIRDRATKVFQVYSINFYANLATKPVRVEYECKHLLVKNFTNDCVAAINSDSAHFVETTCGISGYRDPNLQLWHSTQATDMNT